MCNAFGIVVFNCNGLRVEGMDKYRSIGAFSFLGRYRIIDFPISNMTNSGIDGIQIYVNRFPRNIIEHVGIGRQYNINSKRGKLQVLFGDENDTSPLYKHDVANFIYNRRAIEEMTQKYVVITCNHMVCSLDYNDVLEQHMHSEADITVVYKNVDTADEEFIGCDTLHLNKQKGIQNIGVNKGDKKAQAISMESYVMSKEIFLALIEQAQSTSSLYKLRDMVNDACSFLDVRGFAYKGYLTSINSFKQYYKSSIELLNPQVRKKLFKKDWPIYTKTSDSAPTHYFKDGSAAGSLVSNGCMIEGKVENSVIGRGCIIKKGAVVSNSVVLPGSYIGENAIIDCAVVDKKVSIKKIKKIVGTKEKPAYVKRHDKI